MNTTNTSDIPTNAAGVYITNAHAYLYDGTGTFIADHRIADEIGVALTIRADRQQEAAVAWLETIGYRLTATSEWFEFHGYLTAVEYVGVDAIEAANAAAFDWSRSKPGHYIGVYAPGRARVIAAAVNRTREGMIGANGVMWVVTVDGRHITNADTERDGKAAAEEALRRIVLNRLRWVGDDVPDPEEPANVDGPIARA